MAPVRTADGELVGRAVPYADADPATPLEGDAMAGPIRTADGELVGRTALYQVSGGVATPITDLGGTAAEQVSATAPIVATPSGDNVELSLTTDQANGVPLLDGSGLIKLSQMPISGLNYHGNWDAAANTPTLANGAGTAGDMYRVHVAGTQDLGGGAITFEVGDLVVYEGSEWQKFAAATGVISVNGQTGAVSLTKADVGLSNVDNTSDANKPVSTATQTALDAKLTTPTPLTTKVLLGTSLEQNTIGLVGYDQDVLGDMLVMRRFAGTVATADATQTDEAVTLAQLNTAIAGVGTQTDLGAPQTQTGTNVNLSQSSPTVQLIDTTAGDVSVFLPAAADTSAGKRFIIKRVTAGANGLDIETSDVSGVTIDGSSTVGMSAQYSVREVVFDGANWQIISSSGS